MDELFDQLIAELALNSIRREARNGRNYLIAPITLLVPGVLKGDKGPLLYTPELVSRVNSEWNGMPIVVNHPKVNGQYVSARSPKIAEQYEIGRVYNVLPGSPLKGEGWFDEEDTKRVDARVYNALIRGTKLEVSTGIVQASKQSPEGAVYNGKPYVAEVVHYKPDHLAVLPDEVGACAIRDGCGVNNALSMLQNAQPSHEDLRSQLQVLLDTRFGMGGMGGYGPPGMGCYILDVYDKEVVYSAYEKLWKIKYVTDLRTSTVSLAQEAPVEVRKVVTYKPIANQQGPTSEVEPVTSYEEVLNVNRDQLITFLVTNCDCWKGNGDRDTLSKFSDEKLNSLKVAYDKAQQAEAVANAARAGFSSESHDLTWDEAQKKFVIKHKASITPPQPVVNTSGTGTPPAPVVAPPARVLTEQEWLASAPPRIQAMVNNAFARDEQEKAQLILQLTANVTQEPEKTNLTNWLQAQTVDNLRNMVKLHPTRQQSQQTPSFIPPSPQPSYQLASAPAPVQNVAPPQQQQTNNQDPDILPLPSMDWKQGRTQTG